MEATTYVAEFDEVMRAHWRGYIQLVSDNYRAGIRMEYNNVDKTFCLAVCSMVHGLEEHVHDRAVVCKCVTELQDLVEEMQHWGSEAELVLKPVIWHLFRVLQAHLGDTGLGLLVLTTLHAILDLNSRGLPVAILSPGRSPAAQLAVTAFVRSCPSTADLDAKAAVLLRWFEEGSLLLHCQYPTPPRGVLRAY